MELFKRVIIWEFSFYLFNYFYQFDNRAVIETKRYYVRGLLRYELYYTHSCWL